MKRVVLRHAIVLVAYFLMAIALTWPFAAHLTTAVPDQGDPLLNTWILDWVVYGLTHSPLRLFDAPIFYPARYPLAYSENLIGIGLMMLPFKLAGLAPLTLYNLAVLIGFAHAGYGAFVLARTVTKNTMASFIAGIFYAFVSFKFDHLAHLQFIWSGWLPLILAALIVYWERATWIRAAALFGAFVMNGLTNIHLLLFSGVAVVLSIGFLAGIAPRKDLRFWGGLAGALVLAGLVLYPVLRPYQVVSAEYGMKRDLNEMRGGSATWEDWLRVTGRSRLYSAMQHTADGKDERRLFPGLMILFLSAAAILMTSRVAPASGGSPEGRRDAAITRVLDVAIVMFAIAVYIGMVTRDFALTMFDRKIIGIKFSDFPTFALVILIFVRLSIRMPKAWSDGSLKTVAERSRFPIGAWVAALWIAIGVLGSFGANSFFHWFLYWRMQPFQSIRAPARWAIVAYVGLAVWGALGAKEILDRRWGWRRHATVALLLAFAYADVLAKIHWEYIIPEPAPVYRWLNQTRLGPVIEIPMATPDGSAPFKYTFNATAHHVPIMNGTSGFDPPLYDRLKTKFEQRKVDDSILRSIELTGTKLIILHAGSLTDAKPVELPWLEEALDSGRIAFLRRFNSGVWGDYVFAIVRNLPDWPKYVDLSLDAAGFRSEVTLRRMLDGLPTYNSSTFGIVEMPRVLDRVERELRVSGWALSPSGVSKVVVRIHGGKWKYDTERYIRPDVVAKFPWYPKVETPGFHLSIPKRPKGMPRETDVQVEITDGEGKVTRLPDAIIYWD